jgi:hypothetical protein
VFVQAWKAAGHRVTARFSTWATIARNLCLNGAPARTPSTESLDTRGTADGAIGRAEDPRASGVTGESC